VNTSFSVIVTSHAESENFFEGIVTSSVHSAWLVTVTLKEMSTLFMTGYNSPKRSVCSLMTGYNYTKRSVQTSHEE
jgi:hypothetical protein